MGEYTWKPTDKWGLYDDDGSIAWSGEYPSEAAALEDLKVLRKEHPEEFKNVSPQRIWVRDRLRPT